MKRLRAPFLLSLAMGGLALACGTEAPAIGADGDPGKPLALITVDRSEPSSPGAEGSASAMARFLSVPAASDPARALAAVGATLDLPAPDTCQSTETADEPTLPSQGPVEFLEAGDVSILASGSVTPLVPHAFPTVGGFASGVLYATRDRASGSLPSATSYSFSTTGSASVPALRALVDAPRAPSDVQLDGVAFSDLIDVRTDRPLDLSWVSGEDGDTIYAELLAYDGSASVVCTFRDETGAGVIPEGTFSGTGEGRIAVHRLRARHFEEGVSLSGLARFDFQVGAPVEFGKFGS